MSKGKRLRAMAVVTVLGLLAAGHARAASIWVEGEGATISMVQRDPAMDSVKKDALSGGDWASNYSAQRPGVLDYRFQVPRAGDYTFYVRACPVSASLSYSLNAGAWTAVDLSKPLDLTNIAADGKDDLRVVAWLDLGKISLSAGANKITFRMDSPQDNHGAIDCFLFTTDEFVPKGIEKPAGSASSLPAPPPVQGSWAFQPGRDTYDPAALLDLRSLNEKAAGEHGFIKLSADGSDFLRGDGEPIRFWAVNTGIWETSMPELIADHARFLAKRGVNLVRWHGNITPKDKNSTLADFDKDQRDKLWRYVADMKKEGIYMTISPYWANSASPKPGWGLPLNGGNDMHALLFFEPKLQAAYKQWLKDIYEPVNPYTGVALKDEPAVAIIQIQNEDSLLFWTINNLKGGDLDLLSRQFGDWLTKKYGSARRRPPGRGRARRSTATTWPRACRASTTSGR